MRSAGKDWMLQTSIQNSYKKLLMDIKIPTNTLTYKWNYLKIIKTSLTTISFKLSTVIKNGIMNSLPGNVGYLHFSCIKIIISVSGSIMVTLLKQNTAFGDPTSQCYCDKQKLHKNMSSW